MEFAVLSICFRHRENQRYLLYRYKRQAKWRALTLANAP